MPSANLTVTISYKREGLLLYCWVGNQAMATIDLKEYWGLTEEQAQELLTKLDEGNRQKAEVREWGC